MMKKIMILSVLLIALMVMNSCDDDDCSCPEASLAEKLVGEWITEQPFDNVVPGLDGDSKIPACADMSAIIYHFDADGTGWKELVLMKEGKSIYYVINRYEEDAPFSYSVDKDGKICVDFTEVEVGEELKFNGTTLTIPVGGLKFNLVRATDDQITKYKEESDAWHGGSDEDNTTETGINDQYANEPSRARKNDIGL